MGSRRVLLVGPRFAERQWKWLSCERSFILVAIETFQSAGNVWILFKKFQGVMTRIANRAFEMSSKSTGHGAIQVPDIPRFKRCAYLKSGGIGGIIRDSRHDPLPTRPVQKSTVIDVGINFLFHLSTEWGHCSCPDREHRMASGQYNIVCYGTS